MDPPARRSPGDRRDLTPDATLQRPVKRSTARADAPTVEASAPFASLLSAASEGAEWAWTRLYQTYAGRVLGYLRSRGAVDAEDLVGDVFLQIARNLPTFEGDEPAFRSWLFMVAHHRLIDERRRRTRRPVHLVDEPHELDRPAAVDVEAVAIGSISHADTLALLDELTEDQRAVIVMRMLGGLTLEETAQAMEKTLGAVTQLQRRALGALRKMLERRGVTQ